MMPDFEAMSARVVDRTIELARIPAPTFGEAERARVLVDWWREAGVECISVDDVGNVVGRVREGASGNDGCLLIAAHMDTVFGTDVDHEPRREGDRLVGPGVGDNTISLATLSDLTNLLPTSTHMPVWIAATIAEEGLGNLRGMTHLLAAPPTAVSAVVALEGNYLGRVNAVGVGSHRWRVVLTGPGGHSWEEGHHASAVEAAASMIVSITSSVRGAAEQLPGRSAINVGTVSGGESINSRARSCTFEIDLRADSATALAHLAPVVQDVVHRLKDDLDAIVTDIGHRPAGSTDPSHPLIAAAVTAAQENGLQPELTAASTDANAAYALGIPAVTLGVAFGGATHTEREWIDVTSVADGLRTLVGTIVTFDSAKGSPWKPE